MPKFFVAPDDIKSDKIFLYNDEDIKHIIRVLRLQVNDIIIVCDGNGKDYKVCLEQINSKEIKTKILECSISGGEPPVYTTLFQGIPKGSKIEYIIQKVTEIGVAELVPVMMQRTVVKLEKSKNQKDKIMRWQRIAYEAAKQCGRGRIPKICEPIAYEDAIERMTTMDIKLVPYENERSNSLKVIIENHAYAKKVGILIGPEGGFDDDEILKAQNAKMDLVTLGPRILRTETAGIVALTAIMYELGDIGSI